MPQLRRFPKDILKSDAQDEDDVENDFNVEQSESVEVLHEILAK
jgi:hypothetical protein